MTLRYVGDLPLISQHGIAFDHTQTDKYVYLHAVLELLEALSYGATETTQHLYKSEHKDLRPSQLVDGLKKYIKNIDAVYAMREEKAKILIDSLITRVQTNPSLTSDEKYAWLNNIEIMKDYYLHYVTNQAIYESGLEALANEIDEAKVQKISVPVFRNYGIVLRDLEEILEQRKTSIDTQTQVECNSKGVICTTSFQYH
jgi:hypothetical protein